MLNNRVCQSHNLPCTAIDLKVCKEAKESLLCAKCLTDRNDSDEVAHLYDVQTTIDDIVQLQISKQKEVTNHLISQMDDLKNHLYQFQQSVNIVIDKQIINMEQDKKELTQKLNQFERQENVRNDSFYLEFLKKNYKGKYVLSCRNKLGQENTDVIKNIKEGIEQIIKSDYKIKIYESLNQIINECNQDEIITKKITQKINQKQKTITLSQDCPIHEQEITMVVMDKKCDRKRLICIECIEECQQQGLKQFYSIKKVNQIWKDSKGKLSQSLNEILGKSQQNVKKAQEILQQQNNIFNDSTEQLQLQIGQSFNEIKNKQQKVDEEKHINLQELENEELLNRITFLADGSYETELIQIENLQKKEQKQFIDRVKGHSIVLQRIQNEYDQQIQSEFGFQQIEEQKPINKKFDFFNDIKQYQEYFIKVHKQSPQKANITLEECNNFVVNDEGLKNQIICQWSTDLQNIENFKLFAWILVDEIKRSRLSFFSYQIKNLNNNLQFNSKQLFYLIFINSSEELQFQLLSNQIIKQSIPLIYLNPNLTKLTKIQDYFLLNTKIFYLFPQCYPIINLSLSNVHTSFGKTSLINQTFYKSEVFEVNDYCDSNLHTIDIMFDYCFSGSRNLAVADVHGIIPFEILIKILPLFKLCIIQMDTEDELQENYEQFMLIKQNIQKWNPECCFIIRNSKTKDQTLLSQLEIDIKNEGISLHKMIDLTQKGIDKQKINFEIESFSQFIFGKIKDSKSNLIDSNYFLIILQNYYGQNHPQILQITEDNKLLDSLMQELQKFINDPKGFYSLDAFPMRSLIQQIKNLKQQQFQFDGLNKEEQIIQVECIRQEINGLEQLIPNIKPTRILELFQNIFDSKDYYNLYLKFTDQLRKFNEQNTYQLQEENQKINEDLQKKKQEKQQRQNQNQDVKDINESIKQQKKQLKQNLKTIELRNIGIELFWRELIQIKQKGQSAQLRINPATIVANMVKKGEPFEFLDGDQLQIDQKFLLEFIKNFPDPNEKVLVLSVLGPQSSGKSTILNKIFGCHFWTSVGRCTKGIYLQLLKITQKKYFDNQFDYVLILDSEGLQNPNQNDPEFDKKIALFILAISDIIIINVKGDIHSQFKNLVEITQSTIKQLSWCFNQNNDCKNFAPFLDQIQGIVNTLNLQINKTEDESDNSAFDYNEVLDLKKENIKILGFVSTEQSWRINSNTGIYEEWRQQKINETFSEEAYLFGVQMINQFVKKINLHKGNQLPTLSSFVQNVESNWQSICRLPDLMEFTELLQYKQDQSMKNKYEQLLKNQKFDYSTKIPRKISDQVLAEQKKNLEFFKTLEINEKQLIKQEKGQIKQSIENELQKYKAEYKILNKICKKYIKQLEDYLQTYEYNCHIILLDEIYKYEEFQQRKGSRQFQI